MYTNLKKKIHVNIFKKRRFFFIGLIKNLKIKYFKILDKVKITRVLDKKIFIKFELDL